MAHLRRDLENGRIKETAALKSKLEAAEAITPGFNSPTVNTLEDPEWCSVRVMVKRGAVIDAMERLETVGASAVIETPISNCRL